jgi:hypothetical protein
MPFGATSSQRGLVYGIMDSVFHHEKHEGGHGPLLDVLTAQLF